MQAKGGLAMRGAAFWLSGEAFSAAQPVRLREYRQMDSSAEQFVLDYLRRLGEAAQRVLSPDERLRFMAGARKGLARKIGESGATGTDDVQRLLRQLGDPDDVVARERRRLAAAAPAGLTPATPAAPGDAALTPGTQDAPATPDKPRGHLPVKPTTVQRPATPPLTQRPFVPPQLHRPMTARWRPGDGLAAAPRQRRRRPHAGNGAGASQPDPADPPARPAPDRSAGDGLAPDRRAPDRPAREHPAWDFGVPTPPPVTSGRGTSGPDGPQAPRNFRAGSGTEPPRPSGPADSSGPSGQVSVLALIRKHPLETAAVLLLGLGGLIDPFPLWLLGALAAVVARGWDARDKSAALVLPVVFALIGGIVVAGLTARSGSLAGFAHTVRIDGGDLMRAGAVFGAAYLAWRVRQGRRPRREPPWRRTPQK